MASRKTLGVAVALLLLSVPVAASAQERSAPKPSQPPKSVKAGSVTAPEGITKDQADAILNELMQIRLLPGKTATACLAHAYGHSCPTRKRKDKDGGRLLTGPERCSFDAG